GFEAIVGVEDFDECGTDEIIASNGKSIFVLDADDGTVLWSEYHGPPSHGGFMHTAARHFYADDVAGGQQLAIGLLSSKKVVVWDFGTGSTRSPKLRLVLSMDDFFHPSLLMADINGDDRDELVITKLSAVYAFDNSTGDAIAECRWSSGGTPKRNYGLLQAIDIDNDGALDLVIISDRVSRHIAVVTNDGDGLLTNSWDRFIEHIYETDECELRFAASSVIDVDSDGRVEIVVSIYNEHDDGRWWLEVIDAATGTTRIRYPDAYLRGFSAATDAMLPRVLVSFETTRVPRERGRIGALEIIGDTVTQVWTLENASFAGRFAEDIPRRAFFRTDLPPADDVWSTTIDGRNVTLIIDERGLVLVDHAASIRDARAVAGTSGVVSIVAIGDFNVDGFIKFVTSDADGDVAFIRADGSVVGKVQGGFRLRPGTGAYYMAKPMSTPVVTADDADRFCAVPDAGANVHVLRWNSEQSSPDEVSRFGMRGRVGPEEAYHAVSWCVLDGHPVVLGSVVGDGDAALIAVDVDGVERARWPVPDIPSSPTTPTARTGIHEYALLSDHGSIVVGGFRSPSMNSEVL
ncbi:MAG: VCBS repeat-containing protein, partial [bacterium]|nr:VCBS repeat-containing protein [Candidatus Kapabacteria bacterium]